MGRRQKLKKEEISEDWCFDCKDGGTLMICDHKNCLKAYHPSCVNKDDSAMKTNEKWTCKLHICFKCGKGPKFYCLCCPSAICGPCLYEAEFAVVKGDKGLCNECLEPVLRKEEKKDVDSNQGKNDFSDPSTKDFFFYDYWRIIKKKECLTSEEVIAASNLLKRGENYKFASDSDEYDIGEEKRSRKRKRSKRKQSAMKSKVKSSRKEFVGWGSKSLLEFLVSISKDTTRKLSKQLVATIIREYCKENNLFHPDKKKIYCDARLQALLGRKSVEKRKICKLLTTHFAENLDCSEEELLCSSENEDDDLVACKRQMCSSSGQKALSKEVVADETAEAEDSTGTNEKEHNVGVPQSPQLNTSLYDGLTDIVEYNHLLHWCEEREKCNGKMSAKRDKMPSEQPLQSLHEVPIVFADTEYAEPAWKVYSRRNRQECTDGLPELSPGMISNSNGISFHIPSDQPKLSNELPVGIAAPQPNLSNELPVGIAVSRVEPVSEESSLGRTSNGNGVSSHIPSEPPLLSNEVPIVIAAAEHVEPRVEDSVTAKEQVSLLKSSLVRTSEGNAILCNTIPDLSVAPSSQQSTATIQSEIPEASAPPSQPSTAVFQSEHPEASAPPSKPAPTVCKPEQKVIIIDLLDERDIKEEREEMNHLGENAFFEDLQSLLDQSLEDYSGPSEQPQVTHTLSPDQIMEAKLYLHKFCLMDFDQLIDHAERDRFFSSLDLLLKHGFIPKHMLEMVTNLQLTFSSSTFLYSQCQERVRRADEERERAESLKQELADKFRLYEEIERKKEVAANRIDELKNQLKDARDSRNGLYEQSKSLKASLETFKGALYQYMQSSKTLAMSKETGQQVMKDIDESWNSSKIEILNILLDISP